MGIPGMQWDDVEIGKHHCEIVDAELGTSSAGNAMVIVRLLVNGEISDMTTFSLLPQAIFKLRSFLNMLGFSKDNDPDPEDLVGYEFEGLYAENNQGRVGLADWRRLPDEDEVKPKKASKKAAPAADPDEEEDEEEEAPKPPRKAAKKSSGGARGFE